jgi:hypothetical protein
MYNVIFYVRKEYIFVTQLSKILTVSILRKADTEGKNNLRIYCTFDTVTYDV